MSETLLVFHVSKPDRNSVRRCGDVRPLTGKADGGWTVVFSRHGLTSLTGFPLPATQLLPSTSSCDIVGAAGGRDRCAYVYHLAGAWRWVYVRERGDGVISQRVRRCGAVVSEAGVP